MFSNVGNIYTVQTGVRSTEQTDASLKMQHHQPVFGKDNKHRSKQEFRGDSTTILKGRDQNAISIDAIHNFLAGLVQEKPHSGQNSIEKDDFTPSLFDTINNEKLARVRRRYEAAKVINAYEHAMHAAQSTNVHSINQSNKTSLGLQNINNAELYSLIKDVETLRKQGLQAIQIKKQKSFMESLLTAIDDEKSRRKSTPATF